MIGKKRLDVLVYERGFSESREIAKKIIMSGNVYVNNQKADKPGIQYKSTVSIEVRGDKNKFVSRGGLKLEKALNSFHISLKDKITMDIGASTGGFTDCMLQHGAKKVYSIDVGYGQLSWKLRNDLRVVNLERTNFRYIDKNLIQDKINFFSVDVSFISLKIILPVARKFLDEGDEAVCLIKPQFEAGKEKVGKKGVVRDQGTHIEVISNIIDFVLKNGFDVLHLDFSPIRGPQGNIEYLLHLRKKTQPKNLLKENVIEIVKIANTI